MEINPNSSSHAGSSTGLPLGSGQKPGERLRQVRMAQKRELADVAKELNIPIRLLTALEADDYKALPEPAFVRGYLRGYARLLGVDANALITRFGEIYTQDTGLPSQQDLQNSPLKPLGRIQNRDRRSYGIWLRRAIVVVLALAALYGIYVVVKYWFNRPEQAASQSAQTPAQVLSVQDTPVPTPVASSVMALPIQNAAPMGQDRLIIQFSRDAEVTIKDSMGKTLISGKQAAAQPVQVDGSSPFGITLPDATAVSSLSLNNETVDVKPYTVNGRAEFRLSR